MEEVNKESGLEAVVKEGCKQPLWALKMGRGCKACGHLWTPGGEGNHSPLKPPEGPALLTPWLVLDFSPPELL